MGTEADLDGKFRAVLTKAKEFQASAHGPHLRVAHEARAVAAVPPPQSLRHQNLDRLAEQFVAAVSKELFRLQN